MRALVISGGGSKGAYAGGVAEYLIQKQNRSYDIYVGSSTGSLLLPHLAIGEIDTLHNIYTNVNQNDIFNLNPFVIRKKDNREYVTINYLTTVLQFVKKKRTFGESKNLRKLIRKTITKEVYEEAKNVATDLVITVSNFTKNEIEYKSIKECNYEEFCDWLWISCNYVPFMSLVTRDDCEYGDGGFGAVVPVREAIRRGATDVDVIILESENMENNKVLGKNPFSLIVNLLGFLSDQIEQSNIVEGKLSALNKNVTLNLYYTPSKLTENSLVFDKKLMTNWWKQGYKYAEYREHQQKNIKEMVR
ncbi:MULTISPECIES: patatin family protein [unclassified Empedobacter]|uniref:patatin-like phospholipase family protein n=1 Tax=unclassified Empedobacter TaxID=2643773 RepID=UPI0025B9B927|nr:MULTISPECIES: patatin-like phospholipase family protein [unclassified Empedobacter]